MLNVFVIESKATPAVVEYRHVAFLSVVTVKVAWVVPAASVPEGWPFEITGGVVTGGAPPMAVFISV